MDLWGARRAEVVECSLLDNTIGKAWAGELLNSSPIGETSTCPTINDTTKVHKSMADVELVSPNDRSYSESTENRPVRGNRSDVPVIEQRAGRSLVNCPTKVAASPHLVAMHAFEPSCEIVVKRFGPGNWPKKVSKLVHFLDQRLGLNAYKCRGFDLALVASLWRAMARRRWTVR